MKEEEIERKIDVIANRVARLEHLTEHVAVTQLFFLIAFLAGLTIGFLL